MSFGAPRDFLLRRNTDHTDKLRFRLGSGDLLVMGGTTQDNWMHCVPKRASQEGSRINMTFRRIAKPEQEAKWPAQGKREQAAVHRAARKGGEDSGHKQNPAPGPRSGGKRKHSVQ